MPAKLNLIAIGVILAAVGISGCTSTSQMKPAPALTETATAAGTDAGFTVPLPETVSVLPESSGIAPVQTAELPLDPAAQPAAATAAFAGSIPAAPALPAVMAANAWQAPPPANANEPVKAAETYTTAGLVVPATAKGDRMPGVQQVAYVVPQNPAALVQFPAGPVQEEHATGVRGDVERLIEKYAAIYQVPVDLVRHVVNRESTFNPKAYNNGHWGLMQIKHATARGMGYDGPAKGLFDAETNLKYAVKYLRGAWLVAGGNAKKADWLYQTGYYYDAKRKGLLEATGLGRDRQRRRLQPDA
ncbi:MULTISPECIES: lytic transglycosylase domain-containing protein [unclassified Mesorhizobium]|uniref:lytic transglycosylase domain-containing protein n=1 Tax=unclassified Mesorhizobium TaxID=325217 RepID=UPI000FD53894|nr:MULTISPECIES: lytic transglycosylase domain-containing protein [unclassified Mesorhizobium]AZV20628.1 lytic transglycosylase domain-containing protein [Mesorhizobium sp. M7A.F.Ce.TU.012.03.2.1]RUU92131.1 lytic transglycosylase domain-containing protein [Mesorhizobium sp. M7A.F.Ca.MR.176.00.0.0]RVD09776.1 lytic transglycosylase domain-containing protein [Mesorhizobium sp. M7A.F.Ca.ET.027.02.1.1]RWB00799.1 MAG: lytic transglycosylase domain-containing protein [Mesorhizobium sp.]RWB11169.1 MAG